VLNRPWRVIQQAGNRASAQFQASVDDAKLLEHWQPTSASRPTIKLSENSLITDYTIENPDSKPCPLLSERTRIFGFRWGEPTAPSAV